ncbi:hypothetical protein J5N97_017457 [Dioscorea zingiberensis]|uniref:Uncharacterized protein n=1 Tax=Dioscorea zingiberensis TaxID=325984 RepID=A0A9D5CN79_9LILI|nr:hypothetical protein J5N97_017457 [Dioscorea zingiberensis]
MGDRATLAMARQELEGIYHGIPDDSVSLSFKDLASFQQSEVTVRRKSSMTQVREDPDESMKEKELELGESPSLDFSRGFQGTRESFQQIEDEMNHRVSVKNSMKKNKNKPLMVVVESNSTGVFDDATSFNVVCGRVYCRECVLRGMGDMAEGRKCIDCLGRRFSER